MIPLLAFSTALTVWGVDQFANLGTALAAWVGLVILVVFRPIKAVSHATRKLLLATQDNTAAVRSLTESNKNLGAQVAALGNQVEDLGDRVTALEHAQGQEHKA